MNANFNLAELTQYLQAKTQWHKEKQEELENTIRTIESNLEDAIAAYEHHRGAIATLGEIRGKLQDMLEFSNPIGDPNAESDQ